MIAQRFLTYNQKGIQGLIWVLFFSLPLAQKFSSGIIGLLLLLSLIKLFGNAEFAKMRLPWFLPTLFLYYLISEIVSGGAWSSIEKRLLLIILPITFAINSDIFKQQAKNRIYLIYVLGNIFAVVLCSVRAVIRSITLQAGQWEFNPNVIRDTGQDFLTSSVMGGNYFFNLEFSPFIDPAYFGMFIVFAQYLIFEIVTCSKKQKQNRWLIGSYFVLLFALFLLSSKAAIISAMLLALCVTFYVLFKVQSSSLLRVVTIVVVFVVCTVFLYFNPRLRVFKDTFWAGLSINTNARFGHDLRILSWDASLDIIEKNLLFGVGEGNKEAALVERYMAKGYVVPAERRYNSHNQYFDFLIGGGLIGFGLFMAGFLQLVVRSIRESNYPLLAFCMIFSFNALFENLLSRYAGVLIFAVFIAVLGTKRQELK